MDGGGYYESFAGPPGGGQRIVTSFPGSVGFLRLLCAAFLLRAVLLAQTEPPCPLRQPAMAFTLEMPKSHNPLNAYMPESVPEPVLTNSARLDRLVRDGKLYLSLKDAIDLALEDNLDLAIARYNLPIADTDIVRTKTGGFVRGVNTRVARGTP